MSPLLLENRDDHEILKLITSDMPLSTIINPDLYYAFTWLVPDDYSLSLDGTVSQEYFLMFDYLNLEAAENLAGLANELLRRNAKNFKDHPDRLIFCRLFSKRVLADLILMGEYYLNISSQGYQAYCRYFMEEWD